MQIRRRPFTDRGDRTSSLRAVCRALKKSESRFGRNFAAARCCWLASRLRRWTGADLSASCVSPTKLLRVPAQPAQMQDADVKHLLSCCQWSYCYEAIDPGKRELHVPVDAKRTPGLDRGVPAGDQEDVSRP